MIEGRKNSQWIGRVRSLLAEGFGVEDIALKLSCKLELVRNEVKILRESGDLEMIFRGKK